MLSPMTVGAEKMIIERQREGAEGKPHLHHHSEINSIKLGKCSTTLLSAPVLLKSEQKKKNQVCLRCIYMYI